MDERRRSIVASVAQDLRAPTLVSFLDMARWTAAALVFVAHLRNPLFLGYGDLSPEQRTPIVQAWYFVTGWHAEAVTVFFVLSGLLVGAAGLARWQDGKFRPADYAIDRVTRLYLPFLPALVLGFLLDLLGSHYLGSVGFWNHAHPLVAQKINSPPFDTLLGPDVLVGNALMLQHYLVPPLGSNQPLWTISAEFWFYAVFLLTLEAAGVARSRLARAAAVVAIGVLIGFLGTRFLVLLGLWGIGVAIAFAPPGRWRSLPAACLLFVAVLVAARVGQGLLDANSFYREGKNYAVALSFAFLVCAMRGRSFAWLQRLCRPNAFLAGFSYSVYLLHFPLMLFILGVLHATGRFPGIERGFAPQDAAGLAAYVLTIGLVFTICYLFSLATERNTERVRRALKRRLGGTFRDPVHS